MNRFVLGLLRSPLRLVVGGRVCALRFRGRSTGRPVELPVEYVRSGGRLVVLAGGGQRKTWWRNFRTPHRVEVLLDGRWCAGIGTVLLPGDAGRADALFLYRSTHPRVPADTGDPLVMVDLEPTRTTPPRLWARWFRTVPCGRTAVCPTARPD